MDPGDSHPGQSELPLIPGAGDGMSQQGAINWDNIVHRSLSFSVGVLNRCANAGVDPYSALVGQAVAKSFPLAHRGRQNVCDAVLGLRYQNGLANTLWFGFGVRAFVRTLMLTSEGMSLLAICSTLGECFHEDVAAEVMFHMVKAYRAPGELTPSTNQWLMIIRACSGALSTSKFPILAEGFMRLDPGSARTTMLNRNLQQFPFVRGCPLPEDLATVLIALGKVATGQMESIHVTGCAAVGFIGALAEWLFDLRVTIFRSPDELNQVYSNCPQDQEAQIILAFDRNSTASISDRQLQVVRKSYLLPNSTSLIVVDQTWAAPEKALYSGRVPWDSCLTDTFGRDFERLRKAAVDFGTALGCAARIFRAIIKAEPGVPEKYLEDCRGYFDASGGQGFILNALHWFPELVPLKNAMEKASRLSLEAAKERYEEKCAAIQKLCSCGVCQNWEDFEEQEGFCLVIVMEAIIVLCQIVAGLTVAEDLHPMRSGLEVFYKRQLEVRDRSRDSEESGDGGLEEGLRLIGPIIYVLWTNGFVSLTLEQYASAMEGRLVAAIKLFTGRDTPTHPSTSAVSEAGICAYLDILREVSIAPEATGRVNVIPGLIEHDHKPFSQVQDNEIGLSRDTGSVTGLCATIADLDQVTLEVTETAHSLNLSYVLRKHGDDRKDNTKPYLRFGPADIIDRAHRARGLVHCGGSLGNCRRRRHTGTTTSNRAEYPIVKMTAGSEVVEVCDMTQGKEILRVLALRVATASNPEYFCVLSDGQCLNCCLKKVISSNIRPTLIIAKIGDRN